MPSPDLRTTLEKSDADALAWTRKSLRPPGAEKVVDFLARDTAPLVLVPVLLVWLVRGGPRAKRLLFAAFCLAAVTMILRSLVITPLLPRLPPSGTGASSFPSMVAMVAFAEGTFLSLYYLRHSWWILLAMLVFSVAPLAAGSCWPLDAAAGAVLGLALGYLCWMLTHGNIGRPDTYVVSTGEIDERSSRKMSRR